MVAVNRRSCAAGLAALVAANGVGWAWTPPPAKAGVRPALRSASDWFAANLRAANGSARLRMGSAVRAGGDGLELRVPPRAVRTADQQGLIERTKAVFGSLVSVKVKSERMRPAACSYPFCDPPLRAGIRILIAQGSCTGGFLARSRIDGRLFQMTAGHCDVAPGLTWRTRFANSSAHEVGPIHRSVFGEAGDGSIMHVNNPAGWRSRAWVQVTDGPDTTANPEYPIRTDSRSASGMRVCVTGAWYGESNCGAVTALDVTVDYGDAVVTGLVEANICVASGDSGSPVYARNSAYGLVSGVSVSDPCDAVYEPIQTAENLLRVNIAHEVG